jgi:hypothetical protein
MIKKIQLHFIEYTGLTPFTCRAGGYILPCKLNKCKNTCAPGAHKFEIVRRKYDLYRPFFI